MIGADQSNPTQSSTELSTMSSSTISSSQTASENNVISSSISATAQPLPQHAANHTDTVAIGVGIGVPLGLLLISGLAWLFHREKQRRRVLEQKIHDMQASSQVQRSIRPHGKTERQAGDFQPFELHDFDRPPELHSQPAVELGEHPWVGW